MDILAFALFEPLKLDAILSYERMQVIGADWVWHYDLGYVDEAPRTATWVKKVFGMN